MQIAALNCMMAVKSWQEDLRMNAKEYVTLERRKILHFVVRPTREASQIHLYPCYARLDESRAFSLAAPQRSDRCGGQCGDQSKPGER